MRRPNTVVEAVWAPGVLSGADAVAESIAANDLTNLYRTSCFFRDRERYRAFCAMYAVMRVVDDRVDNLLAQPHLAPSDRAGTVEAVKAWRRAVRACSSGHPPASEDLVRCNHPHIEELLGTFSHAVERFPVPAKLWDDFFAAMLDDLERDRFATYDQFLEYAKGAAVAPTTIYLHLIAAELRENEHVYEVAREFDIMRCGRALGRFAYLAHVLRDLREDIMTGEHGLLYLAEDDMAAHGVTVESLRRDAADETACPRLRTLIRELVERASTLAREGRTYLSTLEGRLSADRGSSSS